MKKKYTLSLAQKKKLCTIVDKIHKTKILVIGDVILDQYIFGNVSRISPEAPVPVVDVDVNREKYVAGGALNTGNNIRGLGAAVFPCGVVGRDLLGRMLIKILRRQKIDVGGIVFDTDRPTTLKTRIIAHSQQVVRIDRESKRDLPPKDIKKIIEFCRKKIKEVDGVIVEDYGKGVIGPLLLREVVQEAKRQGKFVAVDPKERHFEYYKNVTIITPNKKEAYGALGLNGDQMKIPIEKVGKQLLQKIKCDAVLITLGEEGMALFERTRKVVRIPTAAQEVFDVSGAGDTVIAVLSMALSCGANFRDAALLANVAAGIVVGKVGTATVHKKELLNAIQNT